MSRSRRSKRLAAAASSNRRCAPSERALNRRSSISPPTAGAGVPPRPRSVPLAARMSRLARHNIPHFARKAPALKTDRRISEIGPMDLLISVALIAAVLIAIWAVAANNSFIRARNKVDEAWSGIDVQLGRRHDLVPNLVETVKGYAQHERETLTAVTEARAEAVAASDPAHVAQ